jgi:hypothetical protein
VEALWLSQDPLPLRSNRIGPIQLVLGHQFKMVKDGMRSWHVSTVAYRYHLLDGNDHELAAWHWHPDTSPTPEDRPHLHVRGAAIERRVHLPTGRISLEAIIRLLLTDLGVSPTRDHETDFLEVLRASEEPFIKHRRWHAWPYT